jgi:hypothetical protein
VPALRASAVYVLAKALAATSESPIQMLGKRACSCWRRRWRPETLNRPFRVFPATHGEASRPRAQGPDVTNGNAFKQSPAACIWANAQLDAAPELAHHGEIGRGRNRVGDAKSNGTTVSYLAARIKRDHPDFAAYRKRLAAGRKLVAAACSYRRSHRPTRRPGRRKPGLLNACRAFVYEWTRSGSNR